MSESALDNVKFFAAPPSGAEAVARWERSAEAWARRAGPLGDRSREVWLNAAIFEMLGPLEGKRALDAGCGEGYLARLMAERGAASALAVDASAEMIRIARERTPAAGAAIEYRQADFQRLDGVAGGQFDLVVANMVVMDLPRHDLALAEAFRVLKPGGAFVFSILHPCFQTPDSGWSEPDAASGAPRHWRAARYFDEIATQEELAPGTGIVTISYHRTLSSYFAALRGAGFRLESFAEPAPDPAAIRAQPSLARFTFPLFCLFKAVKPAAGA